jgi:hypothetical protein
LVIRVDAPPDAPIPAKGQYVGEVLSDLDAARRTSPALKSPQHENIPEITDFLDFDVEAAERLGEAVDVTVQVVPIVERAEFVTKLDGRVKQRIDRWPNMSSLASANTWRANSTFACDFARRVSRREGRLAAAHVRFQKTAG